MRIIKSEGVTETENFLAKLCEDTFLKVWSYPNPIKEDTDELCDLIAIFENHLFIFFDRNSNILNQDTNTDKNVLWKRWKKKVIEKQIKTAYGAEKYIRNGSKIYLDSQKNQIFPIQYNKDRIQIHKIVIAHGAKQACENYYGKNSSGSLLINYTDLNIEDEPEIPYFIKLTRKNPIHVFDSFSLPLIFSELDTFYDFSSYIIEKEKAIEKHGLMYTGEEELLAIYMRNYDQNTNSHRIQQNDKKCTSMLIEEGYWQEYIESESYRIKSIENQRSYTWDELIQKTCQNALDGVLLGNSDLFNDLSAIREMAKEPRFVRRELSDRILKSINEFPISNNDVTRKITFLPSFYDKTAYVILQLNVKSKSHDHREIRQKLLEIACGAAKNKFRNLNKVVGIGIDAPKLNQEISEDFVLLECSNWNNENEQYYREQNAQFKFFETDQLKVSKGKIQEFPDLYKKSGKIGRNEKCPCGSGKKYKKCCLDRLQ